MLKDEIEKKIKKNLKLIYQIYNPGLEIRIKKSNIKKKIKKKNLLKKSVQENGALWGGNIELSSSFSLCQCLAVPFQITSQKLIWALPENKFAAESDEAKHKWKIWYGWNGVRNPWLYPLRIGKIISILL